MDESRRKQIRGWHAQHGETCECGKRINGNGRKAHKRACIPHLQAHGWPLDHPMRIALFRDGATAAQVVAVEKQLGQVFIQRREAGNRQPMPWAEFRDTVWQIADQVAQEGT